MSGQPSLFDPPAPSTRTRLLDARDALAGGSRRQRSIQQRVEALEQVEVNADEGWIDEAFAFVRHFLQEHPTLHVDDLWQAGLPKPHEPKALGPVILRASRERLMQKSGEYRPSVSSHGMPKPVWTSLIYRGGASA